TCFDLVARDARAARRASSAKRRAVVGCRKLLHARGSVIGPTCRDECQRDEHGAKHAPLYLRKGYSHERPRGMPSSAWIGSATTGSTANAVGTRRRSFTRLVTWCCHGARSSR